MKKNEVKKNKPFHSEQAIRKWRWISLTSNNTKNQQRQNKNMKKAKFDREEFGFGHDLSPDDLETVGQNNAAKNNIKREPNHPVNNDKK